MVEDNKSSYPTIPVKHWWVIRNKFKQSIPATVTAGFLATALDMKENSAKANILPALINFKIVDENGKPTDRARQWRDDELYPSVCQLIREEIYPQELLDAQPPPSPSREIVERWFANKTGVGEVAARKMAQVFILLCEANPSGGQEITATQTGKPAQRRPKPLKSKSEEKAITATTIEPTPISQHQIQSKPLSAVVPSLHIDIQIHISPEASATQIDQIFASMATHLSKLMKRDE
ncbi:MAG: DUF5343 domain-containing protein [Anaerolineae bacterium]|nr:DUF5343 domain-containing protein [Anaerolineae bacterium]